jgi:hypothetical protein
MSMSLSGFVLVYRAYDKILANFGMPRRGVLLLAIVQLKPVLEFSEGFVDREHQDAFLK